MNRNNIVEELVTKYLAGETSGEEEKQVLSWIAQNPENEREFMRLKKVFVASQNHYGQSKNLNLDIDIDQEWKHFVQQTGKGKNPTIFLQNSRRLWLRVAATFILLAVSGWIINYVVSRNSEVHFQTAENTLTISLPDGTQVVLNQNSELSYAKAFGEETRSIKLVGEGFFEVAHDPQKPFIIQVGESQVEVVGTSFNVQGYADRKELEVVVQTGIVKFSIPGLQKEVRLTAGQKGVYEKVLGELAFLPNSDVNFLAWNTRKIVFAGSHLSTVIETINKVYHSNIVLTTDAPPTCVLTVSFDHQSLEAVLHVLESTLNLKYVTKGDRIEITHAGC